MDPTKPILTFLMALVVLAVLDALFLGAVVVDQSVVDILNGA